MAADPVALGTAAPVAEGAGLAPARALPREAVGAPLRRGLDLLLTSLPTLLMALLALGSWWLVKNTPLFEPGAEGAPVRHRPDYTMTNFLVQRFTAAGTMSAQLEGDTMRHYPDDGTIEVDNPRLRAIAADGQVTRGTGRKAVANKDGSEVQLIGDAHVVREATARDAAIEFRSQFLHVLQLTEQVRTHLPVVLTQGATEVRADAMVYDNLARTAVFTGKVRAVIVSPPPLPRK